MFMTSWRKRSSFIRVVLQIRLAVLFAVRLDGRPVPGGLRRGDGAEHGFAGVPPRGRESVFGAAQGGVASGLHAGRHGLAQHCRQLSDPLLLLVTPDTDDAAEILPKLEHPSPRFLLPGAHETQSRTAPDGLQEKHRLYSSCSSFTFTRLFL